MKPLSNQRYLPQLSEVFLFLNLLSENLFLCLCHPLALALALLWPACMQVFLAHL